MPAVSPEQYGAMQAAANNQGALGIPQGVAKDFVNETPKVRRSQFAKALARKKKKQQK